MADEKKKPDENAEENAEPKKAAQSEDKPPKKAADSEEMPKGETIPDEQKKPSEGKFEGNASNENDPEDIPTGSSEEDKLREENLRLKTQLEAMKTGFKTAVIEDAVILAESMAKRDNIDIKKALQEISKKYPEWKSESKDKSKTGFRVGGGTSGRLSNSNNTEKPTAQKRWNKFNQS